MAMLAEPRRKQRIGPNPRGKFFTEDDDNRGRQMLLKMGWSRGDGLGATMQGMSNPIKPKINTESRGLGFDKNEDPWVAHNDEFEELLKKLNSVSNSSGGEISEAKKESDEEEETLEKKSKASRSRIHYHKFVKNKDLSSASSSDISSIFGKPVQTKANNNSKSENVVGVILPTEKRKYKDLSEPESESTVDLLSDQPNKKKKKKKNEKINNDNEVNAELIDVPNIIESSSDELAKKKKRKKRYAEELEIAVVEEEIIISKIMDADLNPTKSSSDERVKKKKKKKRHTEDLDLQITSKKELKDDENINLSQTETKINAEKNEIDLNPTTESSSEEGVKKKKKKKRHIQEMDDHTTEKVIDELSINKDGTATDEPTKKKKIKKHNVEPQEYSVLAIDSVGENESVPNSDIEIKKKKKKHKKNKAEKSIVMCEDGVQETKQDTPEPPKESFGGSGMQFINSGTIDDYFRRKRHEMQMKRLAAAGNTPNPSIC